MTNIEDIESINFRKVADRVSIPMDIFDMQEEDAKISTQKVNPAQGPNEKKAIAYLDGFLSIPNITDHEKDLINKAKRAITTGRFQNLQRDVNKMKNATKKTPIKPVVLLEQIIKLVSEYPLEHIPNINTENQIEKIKMISSQIEKVPLFLVSHQYI